MANEPTPTPDDASDTESDSRSSSSMSWVQSLRSRIGLSDAPTLRDLLEVAINPNTPNEDDFSDEERAMLRRLLRFGASRVEDVMVPRADIIACDQDDTIYELLKTFQDAGVSRVPVFNDTLDDPRGMIHIKDLFRWLMADALANGRSTTGDKGSAKATSNGVKTQTKKLLHGLSEKDLATPIAMAKIRREILYVPPSMPAANLLLRMQSTRIHMALVVDEYGGTDGLVTIEDLLEQVVGDIEDEHDEEEEAHIIEDPKRGLIAAARTPVEALEEHVGRKLLTPDEQEDVDTLGGLVFTLVGRVPARGEIVRHSSGYEFEVLDADPRRVKTLRILPPTMADDASNTLAAEPGLRGSDAGAPQALAPAHAPANANANAAAAVGDRSAGRAPERDGDAAGIARSGAASTKAHGSEAEPKPAKG